MEIETKRLRCYPVSDTEMSELIEKENIPEMKQAYSEMLEGCIEHPEKRIWYAVWYMELKETGRIIGDFSFKGLNDDGMIEIGYGLRDGCCGNGYMTETVTAVSEWALKQNGVKYIEAETEAGNTASQNVLIKSGYIPTGKNGEEGPRFMYNKTNKYYSGKVLR